MRLGIIGYANNTGIGNMLLELARQFEISAYLVIPNVDKGTYPELVKGLTKEMIVADKWQPSNEEVDWLLDRCDTVLTVETDYRSSLFERAKRAKVKTVMFPMYEWWDKKYEAADLAISISDKCQEYISHTNKIRLEWGLDLSKFQYKERGHSDGNLVFVHNAGFGGLNWRKGTIEATEAFMKVKDTELRLLLRAQFPIEQLPNYKDIVSDKRIEIQNIQFPSSSELYQDGDVLLYPSRYDGHSLVTEEASACGMIVFTTDAAPMNEICFDNRFLIKVKEKQILNIHSNKVDMNFVDTDVLADKIRWINKMPKGSIRLASRINREAIENNYSWDVLRESYLEAFKL